MDLAIHRGPADAERFRGLRVVAVIEGHNNGLSGQARCP